MELDPAKLNDYPIKILQNYCKTQNLAVRGTRKNDYVLVILAHLQKTNKTDGVKIARASAKLGIDAEAVKKWEEEEQRRRDEERVKYEQWRAEEDERKRKAHAEELRLLEEKQRQAAREEEAKREWHELKKKGARRRELDAQRARERALGSVGQLPWTLDTFLRPYPAPSPQTSLSPSPSPTAAAAAAEKVRRLKADPTSYFSRLPDGVLAHCLHYVDPASSSSSSSSAATAAAERTQGQMRCLHVEKPEAGHAVRIVAALELNKKGQRSLVVINKPGLSYLEQLEQAEVWVGQRGGKLAVYTIDLKHLKDSRSEKWKKRQTFRVRDEREKQSVRQLVQVGQRVWAMAEAEEPAVFDLKTYSQLSLPEGKKGREVIRCLGHTPEQSVVWAGFTAGLLRGYDADDMSVVCEHSIRPSKKTKAKKTKDDKEDEEDRERINCMLPIGSSHLWVGTTKGIRTFFIAPSGKGKEVQLLPASFLPTDKPVAALCRSSFDEEEAAPGSPPLKRVWVTTKDSIWVVQCTEEGRMTGVSAKMSGGLAFPADGLVELGSTVFTYGSAQRMVLWSARDVSYLSSGPDMDAYYGTTDKSKKRKTKWNDSVKGMCSGPEFYVGVRTLWTVDDQFLAVWRAE
ncbi:uncharacterized protein ACA1_264340 [Acanthamoeba castellanii str. Neff]|uniref:Uncharacterized protein n=1 Tax=Acanthamoeba castellanii (strain ATCC 30010 / Neff) TaxID=1257118 RepID=L8H222_ACACF|nr:uncharacterized protein ACA1_264340 [Acanthamoeba castellanii str. Neff]ELR19262.1 hypothetical protein ACA1_264340 [Acanthamoeba castellanii str. Neff]